MKVHNQLCLLLFGLSLQAWAQTTIKGKVTYTDGKPTDGFVLVSNPGLEAILGFAKTDVDGQYELTFETQADTVCLKVSGMSVVPLSQLVENVNQEVNFCVEEKKQELKEVSVKAKKIQQGGDTISYNVAAYTEQTDRVIGDVLKNMPGIEVEDNGNIKYNGKSISKFYIEDMDLLQGRYGIATNNVQANDVATVQILENHQPIKALQKKGIGDGVALNLKLKDSAKNNLKIATAIGGGVQDQGVVGQNPLWIGELVNMYFGDRKQNMSLYKGNNTGFDVTQEMIEHYFGINGVSLNPLCPMSSVLPSDTDLPQNRTFDNQSHLVSINHLKVPKPDAEMNLNVGYCYNEGYREGSTISNLYLVDEERLLTKDALKSESYDNDLTMQVRYCRNDTSVYFVNVFDVDASWAKDKVLSVMTSELQSGGNNSLLENEIVHQRFKRPQLKINNSVSYCRNVGRRYVDLHLSAGYAQRPNTLLIDIEEINQSDDVKYNQDLTSRHIVANAYGRYSIQHLKYTYECGVSAYTDMKGFQSELEGCPMFGSFSAIDKQNDFWYNSYGIDISQQYTYRGKYKEIALGCPLQFYGQVIDNHITQNRNSCFKVLASPYFSIRNWFRFCNYKVTASYRKCIGGVNNVYSGLLMNNYRTFQHTYTERLAEANSLTTSGIVSCQSPLQAIFVNLEGHYSHIWQNQMLNYDYQGATCLIETCHKSSLTDKYSFGCKVEKGFEGLQAKMTIFANHSCTEGERQVNSSPYNYQYRVSGLGFGGTLVLFSRLNFVFSSGYNWSLSKIGENEVSTSTLRTSTQRLRTSFFATKYLTLSVTMEDNYNSRTETNKHAWFADASAVLKTKILECDFQLNNLFNQLEYTRVYYSGMDIYSTANQLRPINGLVTFRFNLR